jgi:flagellar biosynthesis protein FliQ
MTINGAPTDGSPELSPAAPTVVSPAPPSWPWRRAALFLAGAAQLITISALVRAGPIPATWSSLLLAVAPAPLAAAAAFAPSPVNLLAALAGIVVLAVGIITQVTHTGLFFVPALVVLAVGAVRLWRKQRLSAGERVNR